MLDLRLRLTPSLAPEVLQGLLSQSRHVESRVCMLGGGCPAIAFVWKLGWAVCVENGAWSESTRGLQRGETGTQEGAGFL